MAQFAYSALSSDGHHISGTLTAENRADAIKALRAQGNKPLILKEAGEKKSKGLSFGAKKVKQRDLVVFTRELSTMISAGVSLPRGLDTLATQNEDEVFKDVISSINHDVEGGMPLADAMAKFPRVFSDVYVNMVKAGEVGGILDEILKRLATQVEKDASIRKKIRSAMAYPIVIMTVTVIAFFGIMLVIIPKIGKIFKDLGGPNAQLPVYTRAMLDISSFLVSPSIPRNIPIIRSIPILGHLPNIVLFVGLFFVGMIYLRRYIRTEKGAYQFHALLLRLPIIGNIVTKIAVARFSRTFSSLMGAGVSVLDALEVTGRAIGNKVIQKELTEIAEAVKNGQPLGKQLLSAKFFPPIVGQMMSVGEETGKIDEVLVKVADFYEEEVDAVIDGLASIIEPLMIIVLGSVVGLIAASVMGPIASLSKNIGG
ncbi:type II secretion system F family protein [Candidatus Saccharibacteria bacterium]|jgi:type IV pilus assembly protein PilC|nr:type II secretion system F family protein [Candidatus Saccharibacteria bacterium]